MKQPALIFRYWWLLFAALSSGCADLAATGKELALTVPPDLGGSKEAGTSEQATAVLPVSAQTPAQEEGSQQKRGTAPFAGMSELPVDALIEQVLARNPTLAQMTAAWQAAAARYPQVTSLEDPMFGLTTGPASIRSKEVDFANRVEASQKLPFFGKLRLRGQAALAEAAAAVNEVGDMRLQLVESAKLAFYDYYLVDRAIAVNEESLKLLKAFRKTADDRFRASQSPQQDLLQADVEIGRQRKRGLALDRMRKVTQARINTLMHLAPESPLPPPPKTIELANSLPAASELHARAVTQRPDLQALASRIKAERASLGLAKREYYPDFEVMGAYDAFWQRPEQNLRPMLGVRMNVPLYWERRRGAVAEAQARLDERTAELAALTDQVNLQVQEAYEQVLESEKSVRLYDETILPAARENVKAARTAYATGSIPFLALIEAQRNLVELRDSSYEESAEYSRRLATLERVTGGPVSRAKGTPP